MKEIGFMHFIVGLWDNDAACRNAIAHRSYLAPKDFILRIVDWVFYLTKKKEEKHQKRIGGATSPEEKQVYNNHDAT